MCKAELDSKRILESMKPLSKLSLTWLYDTSESDEYQTHLFGSHSPLLDYKSNDIMIKSGHLVESSTVSLDELGSLRQDEELGVEAGKSCSYEEM